MCFMRFAIDVVYIDRDFTVRKVVKNLPPWFGVSCSIGAWGVIELTAGEATRLNITKGMKPTVNIDSTVDL